MVVDVETIVADAELRIVSLGVVTCRDGHVRGKWQTYINPDAPVDEGSQRIHHITDEHLRGEPDFAAVAPLLIQALTPNDDVELVVLVGHNVAFDATALRSDAARVGIELPDVLTLDTCEHLPAAAGVKPERRSLSALAALLGIPQIRPHDALEDALICAEATVALFAHADEAGHQTIESLLEACGHHTLHSLPEVNVNQLTRHDPPPAIPAEHAAGHSTVIAADASEADVSAWATSVVECCQLRCRHLEDRIATARLDPGTVHHALCNALATLTGAEDVAGTATLLGAWMPVFTPPPRQGRLGDRNAVLAWDKTWAATLHDLGRCADRDRCPSCQRLEPCPLDTWTDTVAALALGDPDERANGFLKPTGADRGGGVNRTWRNNGHAHLADAATAICIRHWRNVRQHDRANTVAGLAIENGCTHPAVIEQHVTAIAARGTKTALLRARRIADRGLKHSHDSTQHAWGSLEVRRNLLAGQYERATQRLSDQLDEDGNRTPVRRHHPDQPKRTRPRRFDPQEVVAE